MIKDPQVQLIMIMGSLQDLDKKEEFDRQKNSSLLVDFRASLYSSILEAYFSLQW
jgi:hypothetical protein